MMLDALDKCIADMEEIRDLEKSSNDSQKQEKNDRIFKEIVDENKRVIVALENSNLQFNFRLTNEQKQKIILLQKNCYDVIERGNQQELTVNYLQQELNRIKKSILQDWSNHFQVVTNQKIRMLKTIKSIVADKNKVDYAVNKINYGKLWEFKQENLDKMEKGLGEAEQIIQDIGLIPEVTEFFEKVVLGKAHIGDLSPTIISWIEGENLSSKLQINFK